MKSNILLIILLVTFGWIFYTFKITEVPPGINGDEATLGFNAMLLSRINQDENGRFLPLFVSTHDGKDWKQPVSMYFTTLAFSIFGPSYFALRAVSVGIVLLSSLLMLTLLREIFSLRLAFLGSLIFMTIPSIIIQSHLALENIAPIPFVILWIFSLIKYQKNKKLKYLLFSGVSLGISLYAYQAMRIIVPIFIICSLLYVIFLSGNFLKKLWIKPSIIFILGVLPFILFFLVVRKEYPGALSHYSKPSLPQTYQEFILPYLSSYDFSFLFVTGDSTGYHSTGRHGVFLFASLPLFLAGVYQCIKRKESIYLLILAAFFTAPFLFGLVGSVHRGSRLLAILPLYTIITTVGLKSFLTIKPKGLRNGASILILTLMLLNFFDFTADYYFKYPDRAKVIFPSETHIIFETFSEESRSLDKIPLIQWDLYQNMQYDAKFFDKVYFPQGLNTWKQDSELQPNSIILISRNLLPVAEKKGAKKLDTKLSDPILIVKE